MVTFEKATKKKAKLRLAFVGPAGSGKTYSALSVARHLGERIAVFDSEHGSASKYASIFDFDSFEPESFHPQVYIDAIHAAEAAGYDVLVIDSLSHAWMGKDGALEMVDEAARRNQGNSFVGWRDVTPLHNRLVDTMLGAKLHLIVTMRSKTEYVLEENAKGKKVPRKVGMQPVQRDGLEYEFDVVGDLDHENTFVVSKTRCPDLKRAVIKEPAENLAKQLRAWLEDGAEPPPPPPPHPDKLETERLVKALEAAELDEDQRKAVDKAARLLGRLDTPTATFTAAAKHLGGIFYDLNGPTERPPDGLPIEDPDFDDGYPTDDGQEPPTDELPLDDARQSAGAPH